MTVLMEQDLFDGVGDLLSVDVFEGYLRAVWARRHGADEVSLRCNFADTSVDEPTAAVICETML